MKRYTILVATMALLLSTFALPAMAGTPDHANVPDGRGIPQVENCEFWRGLTTCTEEVFQRSETIPVSEACTVDGAAGTRQGSFERDWYKTNTTAHQGAPNSQGKARGDSWSDEYSVDGVTTWGNCVADSSGIGGDDGGGHGCKGIGAGANCTEDNPGHGGDDGGGKSKGKSGK